MNAYKETFTKELVINLSTRKTFKDYINQVLNGEVTIVATAVMLLKDVRDLVQGIKFDGHGYSAIIKAKSEEVLVYNQM